MGTCGPPGGGFAGCSGSDGCVIACTSVLRLLRDVLPVFV